MPKYFQSSERVSHTISQSKSLMNMPKLARQRKPANPAPNRGLTRCASCSGGRAGKAFQ